MRWLVAVVVAIAAAVGSAFWFRLQPHVPTDADQSGLTGGVKTVATYAQTLSPGQPAGRQYALRVLTETFDRRGNLTSRVRYSTDGTVAEWLERRFSEDGRRLTETRGGPENPRPMETRSYYDTAGRWSGEVTRSLVGTLIGRRQLQERYPVNLVEIADFYAGKYETGQWASDYNAAGLKWSGVLEDQNGAAVGQWSELYDPGNRLLEASQQTPQTSSKTIYVYKAGDLLRRTDLSDDLLTRSEFRAPEGTGYRVTVVVHAMDGAALRRETSHFDKKRRLIETATDENSGIVTWRRDYSYLAEDGEGNWLERQISHRQGGADAIAITEVEYREIDYY